MLYPWILLACETSRIALEGDDTATDGPRDTAADTDTDTDQADDTAADTDDTAAPPACGPAFPEIVALSVACDGGGVGAWWELAGAAPDVRVTFTGPNGSTSRRLAAGELEGESCCGAVATSWAACGELEALTVRLEVMDAGGSVIACGQMGADPLDPRACPILTPETPECEE